MNSALKNSVLFTIGTRPEAIKLAPVIRAFEADQGFDTSICITSQHRQLLSPFLDFFGLLPDFDLDVISPDQSLAVMTSKVLRACEKVLDQVQPDLMFVQGDTTSAFAAALGASQCKTPVAHVEAGLRSHRKSSPFPEEINRAMIGQLAELHFAPGETARNNLRREGITQGIHVVGNTVVDALEFALSVLAAQGDGPYLKRFPKAASGRKILLVTLHRRESLGLPLENVCAAVRNIAQAREDVEIFFPVHPNPSVYYTAHRALTGIRNVQLLEPLSYAEFIWLMCRATLIISDSGGVLEEAETLGLQVLVAREVTERIEALSGSATRLVGTDSDRILAEGQSILDAGFTPSKVPRSLRDTFGDGRAAERILQITHEHLAPGAGLSSSVPTVLPYAA